MNYDAQNYKFDDIISFAFYDNGDGTYPAMLTRMGVTDLRMQCTKESANGRPAVGAMCGRKTLPKRFPRVLLSASPTCSGNNYYKLHDIAKLFNLGVTYDAATKNIGMTLA